MAPRNFQQHQPITTTLRTILGLYAPSSCLRVLLQNADDAKATRIEFVLDSSTYTESPLLHHDLLDYQGPALLARNDSCFKESDFQSLSSVGDSMKQHDITSTGKFGLGFNSVFHWTDMPSVLSGDTLLFLDPHHTWSKEIGQPGGPAWSIVDDNPEEMKNHLAAFTRCEKIESGQSFNGTVIRIPLRTPAQALASKIKTQASTFNEIKEALEDFRDEILAGGLLFLKNVRSVDVKIDDELLIKATILQNESIDTKLRNGIPGDFVDLYGSTPSVTESIHRSFKTNIRYETKDSAFVDEYLVQSLMSPSCGDSGLDTWARKRKLFPWVAIAAPLNAKVAGFSPSLFSILRLPIQNLHPVHLHSLFAISQDRKTICLEERDESTKWNRCISAVSAECYTEFLQNLASCIGEGAFRFWPRVITPGTADTLSRFVSNHFWHNLIFKKTAVFPLRNKDSSIGPINSEDDAPDFQAKRAKTSHARAATTDAYFDFLSDDTSRILAPLFDLLNLPVVRPPTEMWPLLCRYNAYIKLKQLDCFHLSQLFQDELNCGHLEKFLRNFETDEAKPKAYVALWNVLVEGFPEDPLALRRLAGCRILARPDLNAPLGLLKSLKEGEDQECWHLDATIAEHSLFFFAADHMVMKTLYKASWCEPEEFDMLQQAWLEILSKLQKSGLNIRTFETKDVGRLLELPNSPTKDETSRQHRQKWTVDLWKYINQKFDANMSELSSSPYAPTNKVLDEASLHDHEVYNVVGAKELQFLTPRQFHLLPCIVQPKEDRVTAICSHLEDVIILDPTCLPSSLASERGDSSAEFARLLEALEKIKNSKPWSAVWSLNSCPDYLPRDPLRMLLKAFLQGFVTGQEIPRLSLIRKLYLWPRRDSRRDSCRDYGSDTRFLVADDANFCPYFEIFVPWATNMHSFVNPLTIEAYKDCLEKLDVHLWTAGEMWSRIEQFQPASLPDAEALTSMLTLLQCLSVNEVYSPPPLAYDGLRKSRQASDLYDHEDIMFEAAFRQEPDEHFLHPSLRMMRHFWLRVGLRTSGSLTGSMSEQDYLECATTVSYSRKGETWRQQAATTVQYLAIEKHGFATWSTNTWKTIAGCRLFTVKYNVSDMPVYRQARMLQLANEDTHCCLQEAARVDDLPISWSQKKRLFRPPSLGVYQYLPEYGRPSLTCVYEHLQFLVSIRKDVAQSEVSAFVRDLQACYRYLQEHLSASRSLPGIQDAQLWLNVATTEESLIQKQELIDDLLPAKHICLNQPGGGLDSLPDVNIAQDFLLPYVVLLKALGCHTESLRVPPRVAVRDSSPTANILQRIERKRANSEHTDVIFVTQGQNVPAHKLFLTAASEKWQAQFSGPWAEHAKNVMIPIEMDFKTLSALVKHAYSGTFEGGQVHSDLSTEEIVTIVNETLDILAAADEFMMKDLHDQVEEYFLTNISHLVRFWTVDAVLERASSANAARLRELCESYINDNLFFVELYRKQNAE